MGDESAPRGAVLVVDDEEIVRATCVAMVSHGGYRALAAANGGEAVAVLREHAGEIACVILDLSMPGMDGPATLEALRGVKPGVPVLLSSGYCEEEATRPFGGRDLAGFIQKPYSMAALLARIERACGR